MIQDMPQRIRLADMGGFGQQMNNDFGVVGSLENRYVGLVFIPKHG